MQQTICQLFEESVKTFSNNPYLLENKGEGYQSLTYIQTHEKVYVLAAGLMEWGLKPGDRVALISEGRSDWVIAELAVLYCGAISVPLSVKIEEPAELSFRLKHSGCRMAIVSNRYLERIRSVKNQLPDLECTLIMDHVQNLESGELLLTTLSDSGKNWLQTHKPEFDKVWQSLNGNSPANICYTSGTTADPKGIVLTHRNYTANTEQALSLMDVPEWYCSLLILPWDHSFAHTVGIYTLMKSGASLAAVETGKSQMETLRNIPKNIKETRPVFLLSVPALAKNFKNNIEKGVKEKGKLAQWFFTAGLAVAYAYNADGWSKGKSWRSLLKPINSLFDVILFKKIRQNFGGRLKFFIGGGALLDIELQKFFYAIGIPMFQGYGLTEAAPVISSNSETRHKLGSSGYLVKPLELKICDENGDELPTGVKGEIVIRGENVMAGYWNNPTATAETLKNGWLHTGDLGYLDSDGFLYVLGRFKSLLIGNDGEKFSPEGIEEALCSHSDCIEQVMLYNNQKPYTVALIVPKKDTIVSKLQHHSLAANNIASHKQALLWIQEDINRFKKGGKFQEMFPERWLPTCFAILPEAFSEQNQLLNSTMKMVRGKITEKYSKELDFLYSSNGKDIFNEHNMRVIAEIFR